MAPAGDPRVAVALIWVIARLELIVVPVALALMVTALMMPGGRLPGSPRRTPRWRGSAGAAQRNRDRRRLADVRRQPVRHGAARAGRTGHHSPSRAPATWLIEGPAHLSKDQITNAGNSAIEALRNNQAKLTSGALSTAATVTEIVTGALLVLFTLIFFLHGGRNIWQFVTKIFPENVQERVRDAGRAGFQSLIGYVRATFLVALVDAVGIGTGLAIMGIPLALPLASLVFLGAFIPLVGAVIAGFLAVVVALLAKGFIYALITLGLIIAVQQLEGHVLQPLVMGRAVSIHPLAVVLAIAAGGVLAGIVGALLAVPTVAFLNSAIRVLAASEPAAEMEAQEAEGGKVIEADADDVGIADRRATSARDLPCATGQRR